MGHLPSDGQTLRRETLQVCFTCMYPTATYDTIQPQVAKYWDDMALTELIETVGIKAKVN